MGWKYCDRLVKYQQGTNTNLRPYRCSDNLVVGETTGLHGDLGCICRMFISYCNLNKIIC